MTGILIDSSHVVHSFVRAADGTITTFDAPDSIGTYAMGMNKEGEIVGYFRDGSNKAHAFARSSDGKLKTFDQRHAAGTFAETIDDGRAPPIVGFYDDSNNVAHGYLRNAQ
ncbi:MAG TPA: hypothetical protein VHW69_12750 [Rhizomicrobium sp.]|nr:hypothetical protein [Rhizomicrobium sp.]